MGIGITSAVSVFYAFLKIYTFTQQIYATAIPQSILRITHYAIPQSINTPDMQTRNVHILYLTFFHNTDWSPSNVVEALKQSMTHSRQNRNRLPGLKTGLPKVWQ